MGHRALLEHSLEEASKLVLWQPQHGQTKRGRPKTIYIHTLHEDTGFTTIAELITVMLDQSGWRAGELALDQTNSPKLLMIFIFFMQAPDNQKFGVCEALLMVGGWDQARSVLERLPQFAAVSHPPISKALCKLIHTTIEPLYRRLVLSYCFILFIYFLNLQHTQKNCK